MQELLDGLLPRLFPGLLFQCVPHDGKTDLERSIPHKPGLLADLLDVVWQRLPSRNAPQHLLELWGLASRWSSPSTPRSQRSTERRKQIAPRR